VSKKLAIGTAAAVLVLAAAGTGVAVATSGESDATVTGPKADRATAAALDATGGGRANAVERDSEKGATWEVEVTKPNGTTVDVRLDKNYQVVVIEGDHEDKEGDLDR
jgi:hypothetical protein